MFQLFLNVSYMEKDNYKTYCKPTPYYQIFLVMIQKEQEYKNKSLLMKKCNQNCIFMPLAKMQQAKNISKYIHVSIMLNRIDLINILENSKYCIKQQFTNFLKYRFNYNKHFEKFQVLIQMVVYKLFEIQKLQIVVCKLLEILNLQIFINQNKYQCIQKP